MKRIGGVYEDICSLDNCKAAILQASKRKAWRRNVRYILDHLAQYTVALSDMLREESYYPSPYREKVVRDGPSKKTRTIQVPAFWPDQCVHHAVMQVLIPHFRRRMYYWSCGSIPAKGGALAAKGVKRVTITHPKEAKYAVQMDIRKCYQSIEGARLKAMLARIIKDKRAIALLNRIVDSSVGLPIGNYTSAWLCNLYLTQLDTYIKQTLKVAHYVRYMDDLVLIGPNKRAIKRAATAVAIFAREGLGLDVHDNWQAYRVRGAGDRHRYRSIDFVGYRFCRGYTLLRRRNALAIMRQSRRIAKRLKAKLPIPYHMAAGFISRAGQLKHCDGWRLYRAHVKSIMKRVKEVIRRESKGEHASGGVCRRGGRIQAGLPMRAAI